MDNERDNSLHESELDFAGNCYPKKKECIIVDKVYAHCQIRECFTDVKVCIGEKKVEDIRFKEGFIVSGSLNITEIQGRTHFKRVRFSLRIPYEIKTTCGETICRYLPDIKKDIILFMPESRDEFEFSIVIETSTKILKEGDCDGKYTFAAGVFAIIKAVGKVQLMIPAYGFCPVPCKAHEYSEEDLCKGFEKDSFPDFFPDQYEDIDWGKID